MTSGFIIPSQTLIQKLAERLQADSLVTPPDWSAWVKTAHSKEDMPGNPDWYYIRAAAVLRKLYIKGPAGVKKLRKLFGTQKNRGSKPGKTSLAGGAIIRDIVQQLEKHGLISKAEDEGRKMTAKGIAFVESVAREAKEELPQIAHYH